MPTSHPQQKFDWIGYSALNREINFTLKPDDLPSIIMLSFTTGARSSEAAERRFRRGHRSPVIPAVGMQEKSIPLQTRSLSEFLIFRCGLVRLDRFNHLNLEYSAHFR